MTDARQPGVPPLPELRRICRRLTRATPELALAGHRVVIHEIRPNNIQAGHRVREHEHSFYEGHIVLEGSARYLTGGEQLMEPGGALLHGPHTNHAWREPDAPCLRLLIWFNIEPVVPVMRPVQWPTWPGLLWDVALLLQEAAEQERGWQDRAMARLTVVISRLLTIAGWPADAQAAPAARTDLVTTVEQFLLDNLARPLSLLDIADHLGVSQRTLCRQFQQLTGTTVMEHLFHLRMDRAAALLAETDDPLAMVGDRVGLSDPSYFCRRFRTHFHVTPHLYRQQIVANHKTE